MTNTDVDDLSWADFPAFDNRAMKRAIRRGVIRTAFLGALWLFVAFIVIAFAAAGLRSAIGASNKLDRVAAVGWKVTHPNFLVQQSGESNGGWTSTYTLQAAPLLAQPPGNTTSIRLTENPFGTVSAPFIEPKSPSDDVLQAFGRPESMGATVENHERQVLSGLPSAVDVAAVVELAQPMTDAEWQAFTLQKYQAYEQLNPAVPVLLNRSNQQFGIADAHLIKPVYGWGLFYDVHIRASQNAPIAQFRQWVGSLHNSDRSALNQIGAELDGLRAAAKDGHIYGFILDHASVPFLLQLLKDPAVGAVHPYDVAFNVQS